MANPTVVPSDFRPQWTQVSSRRVAALGPATWRRVLFVGQGVVQPWQ